MSKFNFLKFLLSPFCIVFCSLWASEDSLTDQESLLLLAQTKTGQLCLNTLETLSDLDNHRNQGARLEKGKIEEKKGRSIFYTQLFKASFLIESRPKLTDDKGHTRFKLVRLPQNPEGFLQEADRRLPIEWLDSYLKHKQKQDESGDQEASLENSTTRYIAAQSFAFFQFPYCLLKLLMSYKLPLRTVEDAVQEQFYLKPEHPEFYREYSKVFVEQLKDYIKYKENSRALIALILEKAPYQLPKKIIAFIKQPHPTESYFPDLCQKLVQYELGKISLPEDWLKTLSTEHLKEGITEVFRRKCAYEFVCQAYLELYQDMMRRQKQWVEDVRRFQELLQPPVSEPAPLEKEWDLEATLRFIEGDKPQEYKKQNSKKPSAKSR